VRWSVLLVGACWRRSVGVFHIAWAGATNRRSRDAPIPRHRW